MHCSYDPNASVGQFVRKVHNLIFEYFKNLDDNENEEQISFLMRFSLIDCIMIIMFIFMWKNMREFFISNVSRPLCVSYFNIGPKHVKRSEECIWNFVNDVVFWIYVFVLSQQTEQSCNLYYTPSQMYESLSDPIQLLTKLFYYLQISKYSFGIYAVLYLDERRKDFSVMVIHHIATLSLMIIAFVTRSVKSAPLVILIHSISDLFLNLAKIFLLSRPKTLLGKKLNRSILGILVICFTITWITNRLYLFPLRAIYYMTNFSKKSPEGRLLGVGCLLLLAIYLMNIYWTWYVGEFIWRVAFEKKKVHDPIFKETDTTEEDRTEQNFNKSTGIHYKKID